MAAAPPAPPPPPPRVPQIFSARRQEARRRRAAALLRRADAPLFLAEDIAEDVLERLAFLRHAPRSALVIGDEAGVLAPRLAASGALVTAPGDTAPAFDLEQPWPVAGFELAVVLGRLDGLNDLPGALIHLRRALAPGGLALAFLGGAGSLPALRSIMFEADAERPAARMHPLVDARAAAGLLQRAGWADPVVDTREVRARYGSLERLVGDVRALGLGNVLADPAPALGRAALARARQAFAARADEDGRVTETFAILTLSGRRPSA